MWATLLLIVAGIFRPVTGTSYHDLNSVENRQTIVHLFEWRWPDVAEECERFLGPMGYAGVQVSPPQEHLVVSHPMRPWWERYQPVSYILGSRSGSPSEFAYMVDRCNRAGVRIYVDAVINHMVGSDRENGTGSAGSYYSAPAEYFPAVPWKKQDFNGRWDCPTYNQGIMNWDDPVQVRNCRLLGLLDLATTLDAVRTRIAGYLNALIDTGVAGIRVDAAKHIWPHDMMAIVAKTKNLNTKYFPPNSRLLVYQEVIDWGNSPITSDAYRGSGRIALFVYGKEVTQAVVGGGGRPLAAFGSIGRSWGPPWKTTENALVFIDNHDTQRQNGAGVLTYKDSTNYMKAVTFMLALPYGAARVMSSYDFTNFDAGPPHYQNYSTAHVPIKHDGSCGGGWVCEHRWHPIAQMARFRWVTAGEPIVHWTTGGDTKVGFGRGSKGFFVIDKDGGGWTQTFQTNLPAGTYCDVISGDLVNGGCSGYSFTVGYNGMTTVHVGGNIPMAAFHIYSRVGGSTMPPVTNPSSATTPHSLGTTSSLGPPPANYRRTVIFFYHRKTSSFADVFIRGGLDGEHNYGCSHSFSPTDPCAIRIQHVTKVPLQDTYYTDWRYGDNYLDWHGAEPGQGTYNGQSADGTPLVWSTDDPNNKDYQPLNHYGADYWMVDLHMDCSKTRNGWFEFKGVMVSTGWENDIHQQQCSGDAVVGSPPYQSSNHFGRCGFVNVFQWGSDNCEINNF